MSETNIILGKKYVWRSAAGEQVVTVTDTNVDSNSSMFSSGPMGGKKWPEPEPARVQCLLDNGQRKLVRMDELHEITE